MSNLSGEAPLLLSLLLPFYRGVNSKLFATLGAKFLAISFEPIFQGNKQKSLKLSHFEKSGGRGHTSQNLYPLVSTIFTMYVLEQQGDFVQLIKTYMVI